MSSSRGGTLAYSNGSDFKTDVITANEGEDIAMKIMSLSIRRPRAICILHANGTISNVTIRHSSSSGGTSTYEGNFELISLKGSFVPIENGLSRRRCGGISISFAGPDRQTIGGELAGSLVAGGPVEVMIFSFKVNDISAFSNRGGSVNLSSD